MTVYGVIDQIEGWFMAEGEHDEQALISSARRTQS
jgi:hypothetical protein